MESNQSESSSSSPTPQTVHDEVWPPQTTSYNEAECVSREDSLHTYRQDQLASHYKTSCQSTTQVVSYQESATSLFSVQPSSSTGGFAEVSLHSYNEVDGSNDYQEAATPPNVADSQQYEPHHLEQNEALSAEVVVGASQVSSRSQTPATSNPSRSATPCCTESGMITLSGIAPDGNLGSNVLPPGTLERVTLSVEQQFALQNAIAVSQQGITSLGLPIILDRNNIAAIITASRADAVGLDPCILQRPFITSHNLSQRAILAAEQLQFINSETPVSLSHNLLPPVISQRDLISPVNVPSTSSAAPQSQSHAFNTSFPMHHKQMLAQKYAAELESPSGSVPESSNLRSEQLLENLNIRASSPYVTTTNTNSLIDVRAAALYSPLTSTLPTTSVSHTLPLDSYSVDRSVDLVSSTREETEELLEDDNHYDSPDQSTSHEAAHNVVQSYASSTVDLLPSQTIHHAIQSSEGVSSRQKLPDQDENIVDSTENFVRHTSGSPDVGLSSTQGYGHGLGDLHSSRDTVPSSTMHPVLTSNSHDPGNEVLSSSEVELVSISSHHFIKDESDEASLEHLENCSVTHPDSTHGSHDLSIESSVSSDLLPNPSTSVENYEHSRPRRDLKSSRHWCEDCSQFYEKDCPTHRIQLIFDKPVLSRAWASLPATYLYVLQIGTDTRNEPVYGVFAKKTIPKRTQFGPIEGMLTKVDSMQADGFMLFVDQIDGMPVVLDTSDESLSNWMCFVRPAENYKEQNLVLVQQGLSLYFNTTRAINPKTELRVWYSPAYAEKYNLPLLEPDEEERKVLEEQELAWPCYECNKRFVTSEELQRHLNQHDEETGETEGKSRSRMKGRGKFAKTKFRRHSKSKVSCESINEEEKKARCKAKKTKITPDILEKENNESLPSPDNSRTRSTRKTKTPGKQEEYECDVCHKVFPRNYSLQRHLIMHSGEKKYKCPICDMKFSHVYNRNRHVRRHRLRGEEDGKKSRPLYRKRNQGTEWICSYCQLTFDKSSVLNLHILTHAAEDVGFAENGLNEENQGIVNNIYRDESNMFNLENGTEIIQPLKCPQCEQEFGNKKELIDHASSHGKMVAKHRTFRGLVNPLKPYKCSLCYKSFASDERLIRHFLVHGSEESKPLQCDVCGKRFLNNSALACHVKVHSEEKKVFECPMCKQEFEQIIALKDHVHIHYVNEVYSCPHCPKKFEEYNQIRKHIRAFHSDKRYPCELCNKVFPRPDKLKLHMLRHSNHREFLCANCGKQFKRKDKLKEHMKRLHAPDSENRRSQRASKASAKKFVPKVSPTDYHRFIYKCHTCLLGFKRRGMLVNHLAKRHPDIRPDSVPELNLPILKTTRDYYCQYCEKVYKSSSKRKAHILKNHPGAELPMSNRRKGGVPEIPGMPNPTFSQTVGSITTHPHHCTWCHKQYASKAKLLQHQRKKHVDMMALQSEPLNQQALKLENAENSEASITSQIVITESLASSVASTLLSDGAVVIDASKRKIQFIERDAVTGEVTVTASSEGMQADLLTQAMSELTQSLNDYRTSGGEFLNARVTTNSTPVALIPGSPPETPIPSTPAEVTPASTSTPTPAQQTPTSTPVPTPAPVSTSSPSPVFSGSTIHAAATLDPNQLNQLLAQYQQPLSPQSLASINAAASAGVVTTQSFIGRQWPSTVATSFTYPAR